MRGGHTRHLAQKPLPREASPPARLQGDDNIPQENILQVQWTPENTVADLLGGSAFFFGGGDADPDVFVNANPDPAFQNCNVTFNFEKKYLPT